MHVNQYRRNLVEHNDGPCRAVQGDHIVVTGVEGPWSGVHAPCLTRLLAPLAVQLGPGVGATDHLIRQTRGRCTHAGIHSTRKVNKRLHSYGGTRCAMCMYGRVCVCVLCVFERVCCVHVLCVLLCVHEQGAGTTVYCTAECACTVCVV